MFVPSRDDDDDDENTTASKKRKSEVMETSGTPTKTLFSYFGQKKNEAIHRRISGSHFFRAAHLKPAVYPM